MGDGLGLLLLIFGIGGGILIGLRFARIKTASNAAASNDIVELLGQQAEVDAILDELPDGVAIVADGIILYCNDALPDLLHHEVSDLIGMAVLDLMTSDSRAEVTRRVNEILAGAAEYPLEIEVVTLDEKTVPVEVFIHKIGEAADTPRLLFVFHDLTARYSLIQVMSELQGRYQTLVEQAPEAILVYDIDTAHFVEANKQAEALFGMDREMLGQIGFIEISPHVQPDGRLSDSLMEEQIAAVMDGEMPVFEWYCRAAGDIILPCEVRFVAAPLTGRNLVRASITDISDRKKAEAILRDSEERYALAARGANDGLWDWNLTSNKIYFSPRWKEMLGFEEDELQNNLESWFRRVHPEDLGHLRQAIDEHLMGVQPHFQAEYRICHKDGHYIWVLNRGLAVYRSSGSAYRMSGSQTEITERKLTEDRLRYENLHDSLTKLPNRRFFIERLHETYQAYQKQAAAFAVIFIDLDRFKQINDGLGHFVGDQVLERVAVGLQQCAGEETLVARFAGDEFAILVAINGQFAPGDDPARQIARCIQRMFKQPFIIQGQDVYLRSSIGIVYAAPEYEEPEHLIRDADIAMYASKSLGQDQYVVFDPDKHGVAVAALRLESDLRQAIQEEQFLAHYQPIFNVVDQKLVALEALVRWQHPELGLISPSDFITLVDEVGLMTFMDNFMLQKTCAQLAAWRAQGLEELPQVMVNLSARRFQQAELLGMVEEILAKYDLEPRLLSIKLKRTSSVPLDDAYVSVLKRFRELGVQLVVDDFGTLHSSVEMIQRLPLDALRINRQLMHGVPDDASSAMIVKSLISISHAIGLKAIAEGVETVEQVAFLREQQCNYMIGHLFSLPLSPDEIPDFIKNFTPISL